MKKSLICVLLLVVILCAFGINACADDYDFTNMTFSELVEVRNKIDEEIDKNHSTSSEEKKLIDEIMSNYIESKYGKTNVDWSNYDRTYTKDWNYYSVTTKATIKKSYAEKSEYEVYCELYTVDDSYELIYAQVGKELLMNYRSKLITDNRILKSLGLEVTEEEESETTEPDTNEIETAAKPENQEAAGENEQTLEFSPIKLWDDNSNPESKAEETEVTPEPTPTPVPAKTPEPQPTATPTPADEIIAKKGDSNSKVKEIQTMLYKLGFLGTTPDGMFGNNTYNAVIKFQKEYGLEENGIVTKAVYDNLVFLASKMPEPEKPIYVTAVQLYSAFKSNEVSAEATYEDKTVQVSGTVDAVKKGWFGTYYVELRADDWGFTSVTCYFDDIDSIMNLQEGNYITVKGKCGYSLGVVAVHNCLLIS